MMKWQGCGKKRLMHCAEQKLLGDHEENLRPKNRNRGLPIGSRSCNRTP
jgi:hypothetical protein